MQNLDNNFTFISTLITRAPVGIFVVQDGRFRLVNPGFQQITGYDQEELLNKDSFTLVIPEYREKLREDAIRQLKGGNYIPYEFPFATKSGQIKWAIETVVSIQYAGQRAILGYFMEITAQKRAEEALKESNRRLRESHANFRKALYGTVNALALAMEMRDPYTAGHQQRVTLLACAIAGEMGLPEDQIRGLKVAGTLHDIGKITTPAEILSKPSKLSEHEMGLIRDHAQASHDILRDVEFPWPVATIILQHHERLDGSGYPRGLKDKEIILEAKILAVADVVEAMVSHRPYRPALGIDRALEEISRNKGVLYDSEAVDTCLKLFVEKGFEFVK
ncbi:MAG: HD domain-containing phosphohydrolase [Thermodesulfobacteriota bacterium]